MTKCVMWPCEQRLAYNQSPRMRIERAASIHDGTKVIANKWSAAGPACDQTGEVNQLSTAHGKDRRAAVLEY